MTLRTLALWLALVSFAPHAQAQSDPDADHAAALAMMQAGVLAAQDGDWESARVAFSRAFSLVQSTRVLMNLAGAQRHTNRWLEATASYRQWLTLATDRDEPFRPDVEQALQELADQTPTIVVAVEGAEPTDIVAMDGDAIEIGASVTADPGLHVITVTRDERTLHTERVDLAPSEHREVSLSVPQVAPVIVALPRTSTIFNERPSEDIFSSPWLWAGIGAGAALVIGIIIGVAVAASSSGGGSGMPDMGTLGPFHL